MAQDEEVSMDFLLKHGLPMSEKVKLNGPQAAPDLYTAPVEVVLELRLEWSKEDFAGDFKKKLESHLQSWCNNNVDKSGCTVVSVEGDRAVVKIKSAAVDPSGSVGQLAGQSLTKDEKTIKVLSVRPLNAAALLHPSSPPPPPHEPDQERSEERNSSGSSAADSPTERIPDDPVSSFEFWCLRHIYSKEIEQIQSKYGFKIREEVKVHFEGQRSDADSQRAAFELQTLGQSFREKIKIKTVPYVSLDPEGWSDALKIIQNNDNKVLCTLLAGQVVLCGPEPAVLAVSQSLQTPQGAAGSSQASEDKTLKKGVGARDPLADAELTMKESHWTELSTHDRFAKIKHTFGVNFEEMVNGRGDVTVRAHYWGVHGIAPLLESHAVRALIRLLQRLVTSPRKELVKHINGAAWFGDHVPQSGMGEAEAPAGGGAKAADDDRCSICLESYTNKTRLQCSHEFCGSCLERAKESSGPICPVCRSVFGVVEGNQPDGRMSWIRINKPLSGFPHCGTIVITYSIPPGTQTEKHPRPGHPYHGTHREAYLPDNKEGNEVLKLLKRAFDQRLIFTIGMSRTTGRDNQVTWNDIHHKTSTTGGAANFGYPDPDYLHRVREELKGKGIE